MPRPKPKFNKDGTKDTTQIRVGGQKKELPKPIVKAMAGALLEIGETPHETAKALGITRNTLHRWLRAGEVLEAPPHLVEANRRSLAPILLVKFLQAANELTEEKLKKCSGAQLGILMGIFSDKIERVLGRGDISSVNINIGDVKPIDEQIRDQLVIHRAELAKRIGDLEPGGDPPGDQEA